MYKNHSTWKLVNLLSLIAAVILIIGTVLPVKAAPADPGLYDDTHSNWVYNGSWRVVSGKSGYANGTGHLTGTVGDTASFEFQGNQFILIYTQYTTRGNIGVYVDGTKITTINANGPLVFQKKYTSPAYPSGTHVAQFRNEGGGGGFIDIDAIQIGASTSSNAVVLVGAGDIATCSNNNDEATAKLLDGIQGTVFTTGDNAYSSGTSTEFKNCYGPTWGRHKSRTKPVPGNHEYKTSGASGYYNYFSVKPYYAYNLGAWRIYALNSEISMSATSAQVKWLKADLAANPKACVLAYWHRPRWSSGSTHGSSSSVQALWSTLYNAGAELVINGHDHTYERFTQMNASGSAVSKGMREIVVGTGGASLYKFGTILSTSQVHNSSTHGVLQLTLNTGSYSWKFVPVAGKTFTDSGTTNCR